MIIILGVGSREATPFGKPGGPVHILCTRERARKLKDASQSLAREMYGQSPYYAYQDSLTQNFRGIHHGHENSTNSDSDYA